MSSSAMTVFLLIGFGCGRLGFASDAGSGPDAGFDASSDAPVADAGDAEPPIDGRVEDTGEPIGDAEPPIDTGVVEDCTEVADFTRCSIETSEDRAYDICVSGACVSPGCGDASCNAPGPSFPLADTSIRACIDDTGVIPCPDLASCATTPYCGQDAQYGWDTVHSPDERMADAVVSGHRVLTDTVTGLIWQGCAGGEGGDTCATGTAMESSWLGALAYCEGLVWGESDSWRLPSLHELHSFVAYTATSPSPPGSAFWTVTTLPGAPDQAWVIDPRNGYLDPIPKIDLRRIRCVRSETTVVPAARFERTPGDEPIVIDRRTGLTWQGCFVGQGGTDCALGAGTWYIWSDALAACESSTWAGASDWRLPNIKELASLIDTRANPPIPSVFTNHPGYITWSSTPNFGINEAMGLRWSDGITAAWTLVSTYNVVCVRE